MNENQAREERRLALQRNIERNLEKKTARSIEVQRAHICSMVATMLDQFTDHIPFSDRCEIPKYFIDDLTHEVDKLRKLHAEVKS